MNQDDLTTGCINGQESNSKVNGAGDSKINHSEVTTSTNRKADDIGNIDDDGELASDDDDSWTTEGEYDENILDTHEAREQLRHAAFVRKMLRKTEDLELPETVSLIEGENGERVYLVGTAHFSKESCADVRKVISMVQPDAVVLELCASRQQILTLDEDELTQITDESKLDKLKQCIKQKGLLSGLVLYMMLHMSSHITEQLGMAPGGEFRAAHSEAQRIPGCVLHLGDRPIGITLQRMLASLSLWQKLKFGYLILHELKPITAEDVEKMKERDLFEQLLAEMVEVFPHMAKVLVAERDMFLKGYLQKVVKDTIAFQGDIHPPVIVGVVGIGHCSGIESNFSIDVTQEQMREIQMLPPPSRYKKMFKLSLKGAVFIATIYAAYKLSFWVGLYPRLTQWVKF